MRQKKNAATAHSSTGKRPSNKATIPVDHRPSWLRTDRTTRTPESDAAALLEHLKTLFLKHFKETEGRWRTLVVDRMANTSRIDGADILAKHLLGLQQVRRPLDGTVLRSFSYNFSLALEYAMDTARACAQGNFEAARTLLADAHYFAGACTAEAEFKEPTATKAGHLEYARGQREVVKMKQDVFTWCEKNSQKYPRLSAARLADVAHGEKLVEVEYRTIYGWILQWKRDRRRTP
jgi:hypothetical protein